MSKEEVFTSSLTKLLRHPERLADAAKGNWKPITLQVSPTDNCNLACDFCSVDKRKGDTIPIVDLEHAISDFVDLGIKSIEFTGGGDPTMYRDINRVIDYGASRGLSMGMITNGLKLDNVGQEQLDKLDWLRISLSYLDFAPDKRLDVPKIKGTLGFSYVMNEQTDVRKLNMIEGLAQKHNAEYVRIVPNCKDIKEQQAMQRTMGMLKSSYPSFFFQSKPYDVHDECRIGRLKPFLNSDGNIYQCSAASLYGGKFSDPWKMCHMSEIKEAWKNLKPMNTGNCERGKCFYSEQNKALSSLEVKVPHENFI